MGDSKDGRSITEHADSFKLRNEGMPDSFKFKGSAIFITNIKFDNVKSKKMGSPQQLGSGCHYNRSNHCDAGRCYVSNDR